MKRLVSFAILFGTALLVLRLVEGPRPVPDSAAPEQEQRTIGEGPAQGPRFSGWFTMTRYDPVTHRPTIEVRSEDSRTLESHDELVDALLRDLDPLTQELRATVQAALVRMRRTGMTEEFFPVLEGRVELEGVHAELLAGAPLVPMTLDAASAEIDVREVEMRTMTVPESERVRVGSPSFDAEGDGIVVRLDESAFSLLANGIIDFGKNTADPVRLSSNGPIDVRRQAVEGEGDDAPATVVLEASREALLEFRGAEGSRLTAQRIRIVGHESEAGGEVFLIERMEADGDVVWASDRTEARGETLTLEFGDDGTLARWTLEGSPSIRVSLAAMEGVEPPPGVSLDDLEFVTIEGDGPLTGEVGEVRRFRMAGPALVEARNANLRSNGDVTGWLLTPAEDDAPDEGETARFDATGGVVFELEDNTMYATEVELGLRRDEAGEMVQRLVARGGASLEGTLEDGRAYTLSSADRAAVSRVGERWHVEEALGVVLSIEDPDGFTARADRVWDFDPIELTLRAEGDVSLEGAEGTGRGEQLIVDDPKSFQLLGTSDSKATFERPDGRAEALLVVVSENRLTASGEVHADLRRRIEPEGREEGYDIRCEDLLLIGDEERDPNTGLLRRGLHVEARGRTNVRIEWGVESARIRTDYLEGDRVELHRGPDDALVLVDATTTLFADGRVVGLLSMEDSDLDLDCDRLDFERFEGAEQENRYDVTAQGHVRFDLLMRDVATGEGDEAESEMIALSGEGHRLTLDETLSGTLEPLRGGRVLVIGSLLSQEAPFELSADRFEFAGAERLRAVRPELVVWKLAEAMEGLPFEATGLHARSNHMNATREKLELYGDVSVLSTTKAGAPWSLTADQVTVSGQAAARPEDAQLDALHAQGNVVFFLGVKDQRLDEQTVASAHGDTLTASSIWGILRLTGTPARIDSSVFISEAEWIDFDPAERIIVATGPGHIRPGEGISELGPGPWELDYMAFTARLTPDEIIYRMQEPVFRYPESPFGDRNTTAEVLSSWALFWIDRHRWAALPSQAEAQAEGAEELHVSEEALSPPVDAKTPMGRLFAFLQDRKIEGLVREVFFEGPVEVREDDAELASANAVYLDVVTGHGLIVDAKFEIHGKAVGQDFDRLVVRADSLRHHRDGRLWADSATITTSNFEEPGVRLVTGDMTIRPAEGAEEDQYEVVLRDNRIEFYGLLTVPLPPISYRSGDDYKPLWQTLRIANSARFGTLVSVGISRPAGKIGEKVNDLFRGDPLDYDADWSLRGSYLGSRGASFDLGLDVESKQKYELKTRLGLVPDTGRDRGYIRVHDSERDMVRTWLRADSRFEIDEGEWVDLTVSRQSDPGVQSEFWESDFERYERDESYLQWRKTQRETYYDTTLKFRFDDFRSDYDELPSVGAYFGRRPLFRFGSLPVLHTGETRAGYLHRRAGTYGLQSPFSNAPAIDELGAFVDGLGNRDLLRLDSTQRLEMPIDLGVAGLRATPFVDGRFTVWSEGRNEEASPTRFLAEAGLRLATALWKTSEAGGVHMLAPFVEVRQELALEEIGDVVPFDATENPLGGNRVAVGLRGRLDVDNDGPWLDFELRSTYADDLPGGVTDGWLPLEVFGGLRTSVGDVPLYFWHDGRHDLDSNRTPYARTAVAAQFSEDWRMEAGHSFARGAKNVKLFETASIAGIYRWTEKWEFEARETFSLVHQDALDTKFLLRRYGADIVLEIESSFREGDGASIGLSFRPRFGFRAPRIGYLGY